MKMQLDISAMLNAPLEKYGPKFTFFINDEEFQTSQLISDLLSPTIRKTHLNDPTFDRIIINTKNKGHFSNILKLVDFQSNQIPDDEIPFILEIFDILGTDEIKFDKNDKTIDITVNNVIQQLKRHSKYPKFYSKRLSTEIEFISAHFYEMIEEQREELKSLDINTLSEIINNDHLRLKNEDQLLKFLNELYMDDVKYSILYEEVYFTNVTTNMIKEFIEVFDFNYISNGTWQQLAQRLKEEINSKDSEVKERYTKNNKTKSAGKEIQMMNDQSLDGIINYLKKQTNNEIEKEIDFACSSCYDFQSFPPINVSIFEDKNKYFLSQNKPNSWFCLHFQNHQVIPTHYTIRTYGLNTNSHPKSWVIEGSNDDSSWTILDTQNESPHLLEGWIVHTFNINNSNSYKYIRMRQTGKSKNNNDHLLIDSFEIYGTLI